MNKFEEYYIPKTGIELDTVILDVENLKLIQERACDKNINCCDIPDNDDNEDTCYNCIFNHHKPDTYQAFRRYLISINQNED